MYTITYIKDFKVSVYYENTVENCNEKAGELIKNLCINQSSYIEYFYTNKKNNESLSIIKNK